MRFLRICRQCDCKLLALGAPAGIHHYYLEDKMTPIKSICVYCGAAEGKNGRFGQMAGELGKILARQNITLIYGGARIGMMGRLANAVLEAGGKVVGIIPSHLDKVEVGHRGVSELLVVDSMHERKNLMFTMADAFVILPGGLGTLDETFEILTWRQIGLHDKPIILVNMDDYWQPLLDLLNHIAREGFARGNINRWLTVCADFDAMLEALRTAPKPAVQDLPELT